MFVESVARETVLNWEVNIPVWLEVSLAIPPGVLLKVERTTALAYYATA